MKKILALLLLSILSLTAMARSISNVERNGSWYYIYDEAGKKVKTMSASTVGEVKGWCSTFIVSQNGSWIYLFDINGRKLKTLSVSTVGEVIAVSGNTFTSRKGNWIYTYDASGKRIHTRSH